MRKAESRALAAEGHATRKGTKYAWLKNPKNFTRQAWRAFAALRESSLQSARAWAIEESLRPLWDYTYVGAARTFFAQWFDWATHSRLAPIIKVARILKAHLENILTYLTHRITNAGAEGLNAEIL